MKPITKATALAFIEEHLPIIISLAVAASTIIGFHVVFSSLGVIQPCDPTNISSNNLDSTSSWQWGCISPIFPILIIITILIGIALILRLNKGAVNGK